jgi:hypothetical protein
MAGGTLTRKMIYRSPIFMTGAAIGRSCPFMIKKDILPRDGSMAGGAIAVFMWGWAFKYVTQGAGIRRPNIFTHTMTGNTS